jgi:hypothetical protein
MILNDINGIVCRDYYASSIQWSLPTEEIISDARLAFCTVSDLVYSDRLTVDDGSVNFGSRNKMPLINVDVSENVFGFGSGPEYYCNNKIALTVSAEDTAESSPGFLLDSSILGLWHSEISLGNNRI